MKHKPHLRMAITLGAVSLLSACIGGGGGGAGGGGAGAGPAAYQQNYDRVTAKGPTSDMPTSGSAAYRGQVQLAMTDNTKSGGAGNAGTMTGDVALNVTFKPGLSEDVTGKADNFVLQQSGQSDVAISGELIAGASGLPTAVTTTQFTIPLPTGGSVTTVTGAMNVGLRGALTAPTDTGPQSGDVILSLGGAFMGAGGSSAAGPAGMLGVQNGHFADAVGQGTYYLDKR